MKQKIISRDFHKDGVTEIHDLSKVHVPEEMQQEIIRIFQEDGFLPKIVEREQRNTHKEGIA